MEWLRRHIKKDSVIERLMKENQVVKNNNRDAMDRGKKSNLSR
jgi:hypothetical protein